MSTLELLTRENADALETREASVQPRSYDSTRRTVEVIAATSNPVSRGEYDEILDMRGADLSAFRGAAVLNGHRVDGGVDQIIGTVIEARVEGEQIIATVQLSERADLAPIVRDIEAGIIRAVSVGYTVARWQDGTANGRRTRKATQWTPREVSFVAVGADPRARTRSHEPAPGNSRAIRNMVTRAGGSMQLADDLIDRGSTLEDARMALFDDFLTRGRQLGSARASAPTTATRTCRTAPSLTRFTPR